MVLSCSELASITDVSAPFGVLGIRSDLVFTDLECLQQNDQLEDRAQVKTQNPFVSCATCTHSLRVILWTVVHLCFDSTYEVGYRISHW